MKTNQPKTHLRTIIKDLAHSSMKADAIVLRLSSYSAVNIPIETVDVLNLEIEELKREISLLKATVTLLQDYSDEADDEELTDEQEKSFLVSMDSVAANLDFPHMSFSYSPQMLMTYPQNLRYLIALSLVNSCALRSLPALPFWQDLVSKHGVM